MLSFRRSIRSLGTAALALAAIPFTTPSALSQEPAVGERIRVETTSDRPEVFGVLEARQVDYFVVKTSGPTPIRISWDDVTRLRMSRGTKSNAGMGALIGFGVGGVVGAISGALLCTDVEGGFGTAEECSGAGGALVGGLIVGAAGAGIGALIGLAVKTDRWVDVPPERWRIEVAPDPSGGVAVGLNLRL